MQDGTACRAGALAGLGLLALLLAPARTASAVDIFGSTTARLGWTAASGPVAGYSVFVSRNGSLPTAPEQQVANPSATVSAEFGDSLVVWVEAFDAAGNLGPASQNSDTLRFVTAPLLFELSTNRLRASVAHGHSPPSQSFTLRNVGGGARVYGIVSDAGWLAAGPRIGISSGESDTITVLFDTASLPPGEYVATLSIISASAWASALSVTLHVRPPAGDLDGDGVSDLFLRSRSTDNLVLLRHVLGPQLSGVQIAGGLSSDWQLLLTGDYDADGGTDLLWRSRANGAIVVCLMNDLEIRACGSPFTMPATHTLLGAADFSGDGRSDVSFRDPETGAVEICFVNGLLPALCFPVASYPPAWHVTASGDHDGDGRADLVVQDPTDWKLRICGVLGPNAGTCTTPYGLPGAEIVATGDYDGDGAADLLWLRRSSGQLWLEFPRATGAATFRFLGALPKSAEIVGSLDLDGDGRSEIVFRDPATGRVTLWIVSAEGIVQQSSLGVLGLDFTLGGASPSQ